MVSPSVTRVTVVSWPAGIAALGAAGGCEVGAAVVGGTPVVAVAGETVGGGALEVAEGSPGTTGARYSGP
jgi:hypothetical protein